MTTLCHEHKYYQTKKTKGRVEYELEERSITIMSNLILKSPILCITIASYILLTILNAIKSQLSIYYAT